MKAAKGAKGKGKKGGKGKGKAKPGKKAKSADGKPPLVSPGPIDWAARGDLGMAMVSGAGRIRARNADAIAADWAAQPRPLAPRPHNRQTPWESAKVRPVPSVAPPASAAIPLTCGAKPSARPEGGGDGRDGGRPADANRGGAVRSGLVLGGCGGSAGGRVRGARLGGLRGSG